MGSSVSFPRELLDREKVVIVTGGNAGIGYEIAKWLAMMGAQVIIACRSETRALEAIQRMKEEFKEEQRKGTEGILHDGDIQVEFMKADFSSLKSVKTFIDNFISSGRKLNTLVCNAGLAWASLEYTEDGHEMIFQVNYLSQFLLALYLVPVMEKSGFHDNRIVLVNSMSHTMAPPFDLTKIEGNNIPKRTFQGWITMATLNCIRLRDTNVAVLSMDPGLVRTEAVNKVQDICCLSCFIKTTHRCGCAKPPFKGAETAIYAAITPSLQGVRDVYYKDCKPKDTAQQSRNVENQEALLKYSLEQLKDYATQDILNRWCSDVATQ